MININITFPHLSISSLLASIFFIYFPLFSHTFLLGSLSIFLYLLVSHNFFAFFHYPHHHHLHSWFLPLPTSSFTLAPFSRFPHFFPHSHIFSITLSLRISSLFSLLFSLTFPPSFLPLSGFPCFFFFTSLLFSPPLLNKSFSASSSPSHTPLSQVFFFPLSFTFPILFLTR